MQLDSSNQILRLLCETGERNLDSYLESVEQSVETVSGYADADLANTELELTITDSNDNAAKIDIADAAYFARGGVYTSKSVVTGTDLEAGFYIDANNAIRYSDYQSSLIYDTFLKADFFAYIKTNI